MEPCKIMQIKCSLLAMGTHMATNRKKKAREERMAIALESTHTSVCVLQGGKSTRWWKVDAERSGSGSRTLRKSQHTRRTCVDTTRVSVCAEKRDAGPTPETQIRAHHIRTSNKKKKKKHVKETKKGTKIGQITADLSPLTLSCQTANANTYTSPFASRPCKSCFNTAGPLIYSSIHSIIHLFSYLLIHFVIYLLIYRIIQSSAYLFKFIICYPSSSLHHLIYLLFVYLLI